MDTWQNNLVDVSQVAE